MRQGPYFNFGDSFTLTIIGLELRRDRNACSIDL